jgi:transposase
MFLFCASRNGVAAKEVQRQIGVTYKTAWRMCREVRRYMGYVDGDREVGGPPQEPSKIIEVDDTFLGGKSRRGLAPNKPSSLGSSSAGAMFFCGSSTTAQPLPSGLTCSAGSSPARSS